MTSWSRIMWITGYSVAMMLTNLGIIDNRWYHDPLFVSDNYNTVALKLLK